MPSGDFVRRLLPSALRYYHIRQYRRLPVGNFRTVSFAVERTLNDTQSLIPLHRNSVEHLKAEVLLLNEALSTIRTMLSAANRLSLDELRRKL